MRVSWSRLGQRNRPSKTLSRGPSRGPFRLGGGTSLRSSPRSSRREDSRRPASCAWLTNGQNGGPLGKGEERPLGSQSGGKRLSRQQSRRSVQSQVEARLSSERSCIQFGQLSACTALPDAVYQACLSRCINARDENLKATVPREQAACEAHYIESSGHGPFGCSLAGAITGVDVEKLSADFRAARQGRYGPELDALLKQSDGQFLASMQSGCTKACNERGPNVAAIAKQGAGLITAYKRCMMAADSTPEARKLDAYEVDLYCDYLHKADVRCRTASRCDWLESYSAMRCTYASTGVDRCE